MNSKYFVRSQNSIPPLLPRLTARQKAVRDFLRDYQSLNQRPPTLREIANRFGFRSLNSARSHLRALARNGVIEVDQRTSRGIRLVEEPAKVVPVGAR